MAVKLTVTCIKKSSDESRITHIGGGTSWGPHAEEDAIFWIENGTYNYVVVKYPHEVKVIVATRNGRKYLKTENDRDTPDNLLSLPRC